MLVKPTGIMDSRSAFVRSCRFGAARAVMRISLGIMPPNLAFSA
jgi:hypothetical protein